MVAMTVYKSGDLLNSNLRFEVWNNKVWTPGESNLDIGAPDRSLTVKKHNTLIYNNIGTKSLHYTPLPDRCSTLGNGSSSCL